MSGRCPLYPYPYPARARTRAWHSLEPVIHGLPPVANLWKCLGCVAQDRKALGTEGHGFKSCQDTCRGQLRQEQKLRVGWGKREQARGYRTGTETVTER